MMRSINKTTFMLLCIKRTARTGGDYVPVYEERSLCANCNHFMIQIEVDHSGVPKCGNPTFHQYQRPVNASFQPKNIVGPTVAGGTVNFQRPQWNQNRDYNRFNPAQYRPGGGPVLRRSNPAGGTVNIQRPRWNQNANCNQIGQAQYGQGGGPQPNPYRQPRIADPYDERYMTLKQLNENCIFGPLDNPLRHERKLGNRLLFSA